MAPNTMLQMLTEGHHESMGTYLGLHWAWWLVWLVIGAALIWALARTLTGPSGNALRPESRGDSPDEVLRTRYARGEISEDEFRKRSRALRESR